MEEKKQNTLDRLTQTKAYKAFNSLLDNSNIGGFQVGAVYGLFSAVMLALAMHFILHTEMDRRLLFGATISTGLLCAFTEGNPDSRRLRKRKKIQA